MNPDDQQEWAELICFAFKENEIEHLEDFADYGFNAVERGVQVNTEGQLILDRLREYTKGDESE